MCIKREKFLVRLIQFYSLNPHQGYLNKEKNLSKRNKVLHNVFEQHTYLKKANHLIFTFSLTFICKLGTFPALFAKLGNYPCEKNASKVICIICHHHQKGRDKWSINLLLYLIF
jgi:hypothetical protein